MSTRYLTLEEAAEQVRMPVETLKKKIRLGLLVAYKPGKRLLIDPKELDLFVKKGRKKPA